MCCVFRVTVPEWQPAMNTAVSLKQPHVLTLISLHYLKNSRSYHHFYFLRAVHSQDSSDESPSMDPILTDNQKALPII